MISIFALLPLIAGAAGFQASLGFEPTFMPKEHPFKAIFFPYGEYYFNNRASLKMGVEFGNFMSLRGVAGFARSFMRDGPSTISKYGPTDWRSLEASLGLESGYSARYRRGKGEVFWGILGVFGSFDGTHISSEIGANDSIYYDSVSLKASAKGGEVYVGLNFPVGQLGPVEIKFATMLKGGVLFLEPTWIGGNYEWTGYPTASGGLPRWGVSVGLNFNLDWSKTPLAALPDARWQHRVDRYDVPVSRGCMDCCCLYGAPWSARSRSTTVLVQSFSALAMGPGLGTTLGLLGSAAMWDASSENFYEPLLGVCFYLLPPVGSVLATMGSGAIANPGGSFRYTLAGAFLGTLANLALTQGYILITGRYPWTHHWPPSSISLTADVIGMMIAGSTLPAVGAVIGYNVSLKHALQADSSSTGFRPSWTEYALEESRKSRLDFRKSLIGFDLINLGF